MKKKLTVAAAFISTEGRVLLARRFGEDEHGGCWEFPGGAVEPGEDLRACLVRELWEELGLEVLVEEEIASLVHDYGTFVIHLHLFQTRIVNGEPQPLGCAEVRWVPLKELRRYALAPADRRLLPCLPAA